MPQEAILFHCPQMTNLARRIRDAGKPHIKLATITWKRFEDEYPNLHIEKQRRIRRSNVAFLASFDHPRDIFEQLSVIYAMPRAGAQLFKVILPYFPTGTMERVDDEGQVATAKTLARMLSFVPICGQGPTELVMYDVHALQQRFYFGDNIVPRLKTGTKYLKERLAAMPDIAIAFPDYGASKRFARMFGEFPDQIICNKIREGDKRVVIVAEGDPHGKHVVIVDDLIKTGGTLIECRAVLMRHGAAKVSAYATHGSFPQDSWKRFLGAGFEKVWITDSCPHTARKVAGLEPFEVLTLADSIARVITDEDEQIPGGAAEDDVAAYGDGVAL